MAGSKRCWSLVAESSLLTCSGRPTNAERSLHVAASGSAAEERDLLRRGLPAEGGVAVWEAAEACHDVPILLGLGDPTVEQGPQLGGGALLEALQLHLHTL